MKLKSVDFQPPSRVVSIDETVDLIRHYSRNSFNGKLEVALRSIRRLLRVSGAKQRRWLDEGEKPIDFIIKAAENAINKSGLNKKDIQMIIYVGVSRGFIEPGNAYFVAKQLGMPYAECFDIADACMSYVRALSVSHSFISGGKYENILVVNGEFNNAPDNGCLYPANYALESLEQIEYTFPNYTVGDCATATVLTAAEEPADWQWLFTSRADYSDLCTIALSGYAGYIGNDEIMEKVEKNGVGNFSSYGVTMNDHGTRELMRIYKLFNTDGVKMIFPHTSSKSAWEACAEKSGAPAEKMHYLYPEYGNLVSASVPAGIVDAESKGLIQRGDKLMGWIASAGMAFSLFSFDY